MKYFYWFSFLGIILFFVGGNFIDSFGTYKLADAPLLLKVSGMWGLIGGIVLWIGMLADFFKNKVISYRVFWGFFLVFGVFIGASVYFLGIYVRRKDS